MRTKLLVALPLVILTLTAYCVNARLLRAEAEDEIDQYGTPTLESCGVGPLDPSNYTGEYVNMTNPYSDIVSLQSALDEISVQEGMRPLYVLVFGDEEERQIHRDLGPEYPNTWDWWARLELERGDESLATIYGIDIRILDFLEWDSNDNLTIMEDLRLDLEAKEGHYLRTQYNGPWWNATVDAIIGITAQNTSDGLAGKAPAPWMVDQCRICLVLRWQVHWADDNVVQHEVSHIYFVRDSFGPSDPCYAMAFHPHYVLAINEDGIYVIDGNVDCAYLSYIWCTSLGCDQKLVDNRWMYPLWTASFIIRTHPGGNTEPTPGLYTYRVGSNVNVTAKPNIGCFLNHWILDEEPSNSNPISITFGTADRILDAYFYQPTLKTGADGFFYVPCLDIVSMKIESVFSNPQMQGDQTGGTSPYAPVSNWPDGYIGIDDIFYVASYFDAFEGSEYWDYMADVVPDRTVYIDDIYMIACNFGRSGSYVTDLSSVTVVFNTGYQAMPVGGLVNIPNGAESFTVYKDGTPIGATIVFWGR